ncbi:hypothetical protein JAAARDRAFT_33532 [Jaapia argillacea MUCL 33604]|uniref:Uncharacterized protein n=1 Tax=Jaapia argillacea MUCL 33604 TaxID=933084 RepID=A0A067Q906_9AGAM|nr:hypothetical protein JAAARDRAFT_33532 [Jaapia argillacea MUCL 33604]
MPTHYSSTNGRYTETTNPEYLKFHRRSLHSPSSIDALDHYESRQVPIITQQLPLWLRIILAWESKQVAV